MTRLGIVLGLALLAGADPPDDRPFPKFPDGVSSPPASALAGSPFDLDRVFEAVPRGRNAAPLYLDAMFEFVPNVDAYFPPGKERGRRRDLAQGRFERLLGAGEAIDQPPVSAPDGAADAVVAELAEGFRKLAEAQKRDRCVFETAVGIMGTQPYAHASRTIARAAALKARRELERGEIDAVVDDARVVLRLGRDLRRRGNLITQLLAAQVAATAAEKIALPALAAPGLKPEHCDRLIAALLDPRDDAVDPYAECIATEYVAVRALLHGRAADKEALDQAFRAASAPDGKAADAPKVDDEAVRAAGRVARYFRALHELEGRPRAEQLERLPTPEPYFPGNEPIHAAILDDIIFYNIHMLTQWVGRAEADARAAACLAAVRRWQLTHGGADPDDLAAACRAAGVKAVPLDPFDGKPMRLGTFEGKPAVYSVGKDGRDDGARLDSVRDQFPGDLIFQVPAPR